jgi:hypothetical protein
MRLKDQRIKLTNEVLNGIKVCCFRRLRLVMAADANEPFKYSRRWASTAA